MKPPLSTFVPFHPSRVAALRNWREKGLVELAIEKKSRRILLDTPKEKKTTKKPIDYSTLLPPGLDPATRDLALKALAGLKR